MLETSSFVTELCTVSKLQCNAMFAKKNQQECCAWFVIVVLFIQINK